MLLWLLLEAKVQAQVLQHHLNIVSTIWITSFYNGPYKVFSLVIFDSATSSLKYESFMEDFSNSWTFDTFWGVLDQPLLSLYCSLYLTVVWNLTVLRSCPLTHWLTVKLTTLLNWLYIRKPWVSFSVFDFKC